MIKNQYGIEYYGYGWSRRMPITDKLKTGELARLIPTLPDSKKEEKATSVLLSIFRMVPSFAKAVLEEAGASIGVRAKIECYTEVTFNVDSLKNIRPDGLIVVTTGNKEWSALVESKVGNASLKSEQLESYAVAAKELGIDALITISNEFAVLPTHHPVGISKILSRKVSLFHFSWLSVISKALLLSDNKVVDDPEQAFLLAEMIRYFNSSTSGVSAFTKMDNGWREVCDRVQQGSPLQSIESDIKESIGSWQQLLKYLSLKLSIATASAVELIIEKKYQNNPELKLSDSISSIIKDNSLSASMTIPNAAAPIDITADFIRRTLSISMKLQAPQDIKRPTAAVNWLTRQLKDVNEKESFVVRIHWPKRIPMTVSSLANASENPDILVPENCKDIPKSIEVAIVVDLAGRFRGSKTFVDESEAQLKYFYKKIGQKLSKWQAKAPTIKKPEDNAKSAISIAFSEEADRLELLNDDNDIDTSYQPNVLAPESQSIPGDDNV